MRSADSPEWCILLVDDDEEDYLLTRDMLHRASGRVVRLDWAASFDAGRQQLQNKRYDAALIDYDLGARTGIQLIRELNDESCRTPLILYTAQGSFEVDMEAMQAGARLYITKTEANPLLLERFIRYSIEQKENERLLRASQERLRLMFDLLPVGISILDDQWQVVQENQALLDILQISQEDLKSGAYRSRTYLRPDGSPMLPDEFPSARVFRDHQVVRDVEIGVVKPDGGKIWISVSAVPLEYDDWRVMVITVDITRRKEAEAAMLAFTDQLAQSNQALEDFAFIASHDLHEPLRHVQTYTEQLRAGGQLHGAGLIQLDRLQDATQRMETMLSGLLDYSRATTRGLPFDQVDLYLTACEVVEDLETLLQKTCGRVRIEPLPVVQADPLQMYQLLQNLCTNALKYHRPGVPPEVTISASQPDHATVELVVEDQGIGFDAGVGKVLFQPFFRMPGASEYKGTGVGLAICQKIIERHRGEIIAESTPGVGSRFIVRLPLVQP
ncbi:MAG: sensor histidine kinase [Chloroflexota bacterium]